ncbi:MAG: hypothetical protein HY275_15205 [Gemmatimonadetes bacterium]|nr:hypothetical protein [Gemmatimonadota bacterium]
MPIPLSPDHTTLLIRRSAFERVGLTRAQLDERLGLTPDEFQVEGGLIAVGPILDEDALGALIADFEKIGLEWFEDVFEMSGNWPEWLRLFARAD